MEVSSENEDHDSGFFTREFELEFLNSTLRFHQREIGDVSCVIWDASLVLARYLEKRAMQDLTKFKNVEIIELGAGVGCVGIVAACFGAVVTVTDLPAVLPLLERNIDLNKSVWSNTGGKVKAADLAWGCKNVELCPPDLLLLADCVYYKESIAPLIETMRSLCSRDTEIIICQEKRESDKQRAVWREFTAELSKFFKFSDIPVSEQHPLFTSPDILLWRGSLLDD